LAGHAMKRNNSLMSVNNMETWGRQAMYEVPFQRS
jgi:hypothetical protein